MARRGRFGRAEAGSSNLSSLIQQLIREQKAAEERLLLEAFYNGTALYGRVPTINDVIAFYDDLANLGGFDKDSMEYQALLQKIEQANNFDINREYNRLTDEFEVSNGANYDELNAFLKGRAMDSTNQDHLGVYQKAVSDYAYAYLNLKGKNDLATGAITVDEYRSLVGNLLETIGKDSPNYYNALVTAYTYEWSSENTKYYDRFKAGYISKKQYLSFIKEFQNTIIAAGIDTNSTLYTGTLSTATTIRNSGEGKGTEDPAKLRLTDTERDLASVYSLAASLVGGEEAGERTVQEILEGTDVTKSLINNPGLMLQFAEFLDENPFYKNAVLTELGISDGDSLRSWLQGSIESGYYDAQVVEINGGADNVDDWFNLAVTNGAASGLAQFDYASTKWLKDQANAKGNDVLLAYYNEQWRAYLNNEDSIYGTLPSNIPAEYAGLLINERNAANGKDSGGATLTETVNRGQKINWDNIGTTADNNEKLQNGQGVNEWNEDTQSFEYKDGVQLGPRGGRYQYVAFEKVGGRVVGYTVSLVGSKIYDKDGRVIVGYRYTRPDGTNVSLNLQGVEIKPEDLQVFGDNFIVGDKGIGSTGDRAKTYDLSGLQNTSAMPFNAADPEERRGMILAGLDPVSASLDENDLRAAAAIYGVVSGALDVESLNLRDNDVAEIIVKADTIEADKIELSPEGDTIDGKVKIATLRGEQERASALDFIARNQDKLVQVGPNDWRYKPGMQPKPETNGIGAAVGGYVGGIVGAGLGSLLGGVGAAPGFAVGSALGAGLMGLQEPVDLQMLRISEQAKTEEEKKAERERGLASPQAQQYQQTGYAAGSNMFFRNIPKPALLPMPSAQPMTGMSTYLSLQATPMPKLPEIPKPLPVALTPFNPQDPEARRALILAEINRPKTPPASSAVRSVRGAD